MELKRHYRADNPSKIDHVEIVHTGRSPEQNFRRGLIEDGIADGWVTLDGDTLTMRAQPQDLVYTVTREPGYYCLSTRERIPLSARAWSAQLPVRDRLCSAEAQAWLVSRGRAAGDYEVTNAYECVLADALHTKFHGVPSPSGRLKAAHLVEA